MKNICTAPLILRSDGSWLVIRGLFSTCEQANVSTNTKTLDLILSQKGDSLNHWPILYRSNIFISPHINSCIRAYFRLIVRPLYDSATGERFRPPTSQCISLEMEMGHAIPLAVRTRQCNDKCRLSSWYDATWKMSEPSVTVSPIDLPVLVSSVGIKSHCYRQLLKLLQLLKLDLSYQRIVCVF